RLRRVASRWWLILPDIISRLWWSWCLADKGKGILVTQPTVDCNIDKLATSYEAKRVSASTWGLILSEQCSLSRALVSAGFCDEKWPTSPVAVHLRHCSKKAIPKSRCQCFKPLL